MATFSGVFSVFYADLNKKSESIKRKKKEEEREKKGGGEMENIKQEGRKEGKIKERKEGDKYETGASLTYKSCA